MSAGEVTRSSSCVAAAMARCPPVSKKSVREMQAVLCCQVYLCMSGKSMQQHRGQESQDPLANTMLLDSSSGSSNLKVSNRFEFLGALGLNPIATSPAFPAKRQRFLMLLQGVCSSQQLQQQCWRQSRHHVLVRGSSALLERAERKRKPFAIQCGGKI